jgi:hypothetical protein
MYSSELEAEIHRLKSSSSSSDLNQPMSPLTQKEKAQAFHYHSKNSSAYFDVGNQESEITLNECISYLNGIKDANIIISDDKCFDKLDEICNIAINMYMGDEAICTTLSEKDFSDFLIKMLKTCLQPIKTLVKVFDGQRGRANLKNKRYSSEYLYFALRAYFFLNCVNRLIWYLTNFSTQFRIKFHEKDGSKLLLDYLSDHDFLSNCKSFVIVGQDTDQIVPFFNSIIGSLHNLSKSFQFTDLKATDIILSFSKIIRYNYENCNSCLMFSYMTLANILTDKEIDELPDTILIVKKLVDLISKCAEQLEKNTQSRVEIELEDGEFYDVCIIHDNETHWDIVELLSSLYHISVNDKIKQKIFDEFNIKHFIEKIIFFGNYIEKEYSIRLLYQLSFDYNIAKLINSRKKLLTYIDHLLKEENISKNLADYCCGILWNIDNKLKRENMASNARAAPTIKRASSTVESMNSIRKQLSLNVDVKNETFIKSLEILSEIKNGTSSTSQPQSPKEKCQLMISYNSNSRDLCVKIKNILERLEYKVML